MRTITDVLDWQEMLKGDIFALGCTFFELVCGQPYIAGSNNEEKLANSKSYVLRESVLEQRLAGRISMQGRQLLEQML
jgi:serine/threonine protein kinase